MSPSTFMLTVLLPPPRITSNRFVPPHPPFVCRLTTRPPSTPTPTPPHPRGLLAGRTVVLATNQLQYVRQADVALYLAGGKVAEAGPPGQLMAAGGAFAALMAEVAKVREGPVKEVWGEGEVEGMCGGVGRGTRVMRLRKGWARPLEVREESADGVVAKVGMLVCGKVLISS